MTFTWQSFAMYKWNWSCLFPIHPSLYCFLDSFTPKLNWFDIVVGLFHNSRCIYCPSTIHTNSLHFIYFQYLSSQKLTSSRNLRVDGIFDSDWNYRCSIEDNGKTECYVQRKCHFNYTIWVILKYNVWNKQHSVIPNFYFFNLWSCRKESWLEWLDHWFNSLVLLLSNLDTE